MTILRFQIQHSGGRVEQINVEAERALIGSGAHCEIRLPIDQSSIEHVLIQAGGGNVFAQALTFQPPPTINNVPFTQAPLPADAVLGIGQTQILVSASDEIGVGGSVVHGGQKKKSNPMVLLVGGALCVVLLYIANQPAATDEIGAAPKEPALFAAVIEVCDQAGPQAVARAREKHTLAEAKRERRAFHVQDGVQAVPLYEEASACYRKGGDARTANETVDIANALRRELEDDYRTHRMRLEHSMTVSDDPGSRREVRTLLNFTEDKSGPYVDWLSALERKYKLKLGRES